MQSNFHRKSDTAFQKAVETARGADVVAQTATRVVTISAQALQHASDVCRMHFYQGFLDVIAGRLADANTRLASL